MRSCVLIFTVVMCITFLTIIPTGANPYIDSDDDVSYDKNYLDDLLQADKRSPFIYVFRRSCVRRGGNCDHRPNDCCYNSSCRCNLWGSNCRCQRMGLFQKWG